MENNEHIFQFNNSGASQADRFEFEVGTIFKNKHSNIKNWFVIYSEKEILTFSGELLSKRPALQKLKKLNLNYSDSPWTSEHILVHLPAGGINRLKDLKC